ncbi:MAG: PIN domain-containing protein [Myxococcaceae bacterium]
MIAYIDSSVLLRIALEQDNQLREFHGITLGGSSRLLKSECLRSLDRLVTADRLTQADMISATEYLYEVFERIEILPISESILERIGEPLGLNLGTLDAIHLFSAVAWRWQRKHNPIFLTHDLALGRAAQVFGFKVLGI